MSKLQCSSKFNVRYIKLFDTIQFDTSCVRDTMASNSFITWPRDHRCSMSSCSPVRSDLRIFYTRFHSTKNCTGKPLGTCALLMYYQSLPTGYIFTVTQTARLCGLKFSMLCNYQQED